MGKVKIFSRIAALGAAIGAAVFFWRRNKNKTPDTGYSSPSDTSSSDT